MRASDGSLTADQSVTVTVTDVAETDATLKALSLADQEGNPVDIRTFDPAATDYAASVGTVEASTLPAAPANLTATPGDGQITLNWDDPQDESITSYQIRLRQAGSSWGSLGGGVEHPPRTTGTFASLVNGAAYTAQVRAVNANGVGPAAEVGPATPSK